jgi:citrate lyase subunit beta/citryl-CoA lyase
VREVRPLLFVPAHEERFIVKARSTGAEIVLDLEDGCPKEARRTGRANVARLARPGDWIRVGDEYEREVRLAAEVGARGVVVPHATPNDELWILPEGLERMSTIESAHGLEHAGRIAEFSDALILGTGDLAVSLDSDLFQTFAAQRVVLAAKAAGIAVYAPPCLTLEPAMLEYAARWAYEMGFDGQAALHPKAVDAIRAGGRPTEKELTDARALVAQGGYRMAREGRNLIGPPHYRRAERILGGD